MKLQAPFIGSLFEYAVYQGINEAHLRTYLVDNTLDVCNPSNEVEVAEFVAVYTELVKETKHDYFGLYYGCYLNLKALGFILELSLNASSIEQAVLILQNYFATNFPLITLSEIKKKGTYGLELKCTIKDKDVNRQLLDSIYCFVYREIILMLPTHITPRIELPYSDNLEYSKLLNTTISKGRSHAIMMDESILSTELNTERVKQIEHLLPQYMLMIDSTPSHLESFSIQVRNMLLNMCAPELPDFKMVSKQFSLSDRSIQRKLTNEGMSFRKIADSVKRELSLYLKKGNYLNTQDIAHILGYSESSAYLHATKRWGI